MTVQKLGIISPEIVQTIRTHLETTKHSLALDVSSYAKDRQRYWLQHEWDLLNKQFSPAVRDERLWKYCKTWMPDADLGLVVYGQIGITAHRDDSYADWRGVGINLGELDYWYYDCEYPEYKYTKNKNPSNPQTYTIPVGGVFEFNTKNPHAVINPAKDRWAIFLWKVSHKHRHKIKEEVTYG